MIQYSTYRRNKSDIEKVDTYRGEQYYLADIPQEHYNKCAIYEDNKGNSYLLSYDTIVAEIYNGDLIIYGYYSPTTNRHLNTYLRKYGYPTMGKKDVENYINKGV